MANINTSIEISGLGTPIQISSFLGMPFQMQQFVSEPTSSIPMTGLLAWNRYDDLIGTYMDGNAVSNWPDASGNGNNLTQSSGISQPLFKNNRINSNPGVMFDGSNDKLTYPIGLLQSLASSSLGAEMFMISRKQTQSDGKGVYNLGGDDGTYCLFAYTNGFCIECFGKTTSKSSLVAVPSNLLINPFMVDFKTPPGTSTPTYTVSSSAGNWAGQTDSTSVYKFTTTYRDIGYGGRGQFTTAYASCSICEIIIYGTVLNSTDNATVRSYLHGRYGIG